MVTSNLDDREVQLLIAALRYWRSHRTDGPLRRTDPQMAPDTIDILLAKLSATTTISRARPSPDATAADRDTISVDR